jgi:hypothetical protein
MRQYPTYAELSPMRKAYTQSMLCFWVATIFFDAMVVRVASLGVFLVWWALCAFVESRREAWELASRRNEERWPPPVPPAPPAGPGSPE